MSKWGVLICALCLASACGRAPDKAEAPSESGLGLRLSAVLAGDQQDAFRRADAIRPFQFPDDHGPHPGYRSEWWYLTGSLQDDQGNLYGVHFTAFRQAIRPDSPSDNLWRTAQVYMAHLALSDVANSRHTEDQRLVRGHPKLAGARALPFAVWVDGWTLESEEEAFLPLRLRAGSEAFVVDVSLQEAKPIVLQGNNGLSRKGKDSASYYYSITRLHAAGELRLGDRIVPVRGRAWLDHEWSTSALSDGQVGWDWFALQLEQGSDVMVFQLRRKDGERDPHDSGVHVSPDGSYHTLTGQDFQLTPLAFWQDERGVRWPMRWQLTLTDLPHVLVVQAAFPDQRMDTAFVYWEGLVTVRDEAERTVGRGYMELTGYR